MKNLNKVYIFAILATVIILHISVFAYLNAKIDITPGWSRTAEIPGQGSDPQLTYYKGEFWLATIETKKNSEIKVIHSPDGINWSDHTMIEKESPEKCSIGDIQWLHRNGALWIIWTGGIRDNGCQEIVYYSVLTTIGWTPPQIIHQWEPEYYIREVSNAPGGGFAVLGDYGYSDCFIQTSHKNVWNNPVFPTKTQHTRCIDIILDKNNVLWAVYSEGHPISAVSVSVSEDGVTWDSPRDIVNNENGTAFLQHTDKYILFYYTSETLVMGMSSDTLTWSDPTPVWVDSHEFSAVSADSTLWALVEDTTGRYLIQFSEQKFWNDTQKMQKIILRNRIFSILPALTIGIGGFLIERSFVYYNVLQKIRKKTLTEKQRKVLKILMLAIPMLGFANPFFPIDYFTIWLTVAAFATVAGLYIFLAEEGEKYFKFFWLWVLYITIFWILAFFISVFR